MHRKRLDAMNDKTALVEAIDSELRRALAIAPSADFTARLRRRVSEEPRPARWPGGLRLAAVGAVSIAMWFAASVAPPPARDHRVSVALAPRAGGPTTKPGAASSPQLVTVANPGARRAAVGAGRRSHTVEAPARKAVVTSGTYRWATNADTDFVSDTNFVFPMASTLESPPVAMRDVREPNEGLLEGRAADMALTHDFRWSEQ